MADLKTRCKPLLPTLAFVNLFFEDPNSEFGLYRRLVVRWTDIAISEYDKARGAILAEIEQGKRSIEEMNEGWSIVYMLDFADSIEHCLQLTRRLIRALDRLKGMSLVEIDRTVRRYLESQSQNLVDARNFCEHTGEIISGGKLPRTGSFFARLTEDQKGIEVGDKIVTFTQLENTLHKFHDIAQTLVDTQTGFSNVPKTNNKHSGEI